MNHSPANGEAMANAQAPNLQTPLPQMEALSPWDADDFGWSLSHGLNGLANRIIAASDSDLGDLCVALANAPRGMIEVVLALCDYAGREIDWSAIWLARQPI